MPLTNRRNPHPRKYKLLQTVYLTAAPNQYIKTYIVSTLSDSPKPVYLVAGFGPRVPENLLLTPAEAKIKMTEI